MTRDDIIRMAREAGFPFNKYGLLAADDEGEIDADEMFERFAVLVRADQREKMKWDGWRQCAKGQHTTQFCGQLQAAVKAEREACAAILEANAAVCRNNSALHDVLIGNALAIRARGQA